MTYIIKKKTENKVDDKEKGISLSEISDVIKEQFENSNMKLNVVKEINTLKLFLIAKINETIKDLSLKNAELKNISDNYQYSTTFKLHELHTKIDNTLRLLDVDPKNLKELIIDKNFLPIVSERNKINDEMSSIRSSVSETRETLEEVNQRQFKQFNDVVFDINEKINQTQSFVSNLTSEFITLNQIDSYITDKKKKSKTKVIEIVKRGKDGEKGDIGRMPNHQIVNNFNGVQIRFETPDGEWGEWIVVSNRGVATVERFILTSTDITNAYIDLSGIPDVTKRIDVFLNGLLLEDTYEWVINTQRINFTSKVELIATDRLVIKYDV
jgi:hypothetical protein